MPATARLIVMMAPDEKTALEAQADAANVSTAEFVRCRLFGRGAPEEQTMVQMLAELEPLIRRAARTIDANLSKIRSLRRDSAERDAHASDGARTDLTRDELLAIADRLQLRDGGATGRQRRRRAR